MTWFFLSLLSIFAIATAELTQQHLLNAKNSLDEKSSTVFTLLFQTLVVFPLIFIFGEAHNIFSVFDRDILPKILLVTFISYFSIIFYFKSFKVKNISVSTIFVSFSAIVSTFLGIIFFSESTSYLKFLGIGLILIAIILINYKKVIIERNHFYGLIAGFIFGIAYTIDKSIVLDIDPLVYMFWLFLIISVWGFFFSGKSIFKAVRDKRAFPFKSIIVSGLGYVLYNLFTFIAYRNGGEVGRVDAINNAEVFLIILFEFFILRHTEGTARKLLSAGLAIAGILILGFVG